MLRDLHEYFGKSPEILGEEQIKEYLHHLISEQKSDTYINGVYSALKFLYQVSLQRNWSNLKIPRTKKRKRLPEVPFSERIFVPSFV